MYLNRQPTGIEEICRLLIDGHAMKFPFRREFSRPDDDVGVPFLCNISLNRGLFSSHLRPHEIAFDGYIVEPIPIDSHQKRFYKVPIDTDAAESSFLDCLERRILQGRHELDTHVEGSALIGQYIGKGSERENIESGQKLTCSCLVISVRQLNVH